MLSSLSFDQAVSAFSLVSDWQIGKVVDPSPGEAAHCFRLKEEDPDCDFSEYSFIEEDEEIIHYYGVDDSRQIAASVGCIKQSHGVKKNQVQDGVVRFINLSYYQQPLGDTEQCGYMPKEIT